MLLVFFLGGHFHVLGVNFQARGRLTSRSTGLSFQVSSELIYRSPAVNLQVPAGTKTHVLFCVFRGRPIASQCTFTCPYERMREQ